MVDPRYFQFVLAAMLKKLREEAQAAYDGHIAWATPRLTALDMTMLVAGDACLVA